MSAAHSSVTGSIYIFHETVAPLPSQITCKHQGLYLLLDMPAPWVSQHRTRERPYGLLCAYTHEQDMIMLPPSDQILILRRDVMNGECPFLSANFTTLWFSTLNYALLAPLYASSGFILWGGRPTEVKQHGKTRFDVDIAVGKLVLTPELQPLRSLNLSLRHSSFTSPQCVHIA
jgi:hypothetical protein